VASFPGDSGLLCGDAGPFSGVEERLLVETLGEEGMDLVDDALDSIDCVEILLSCLVNDVL
jgi:hypothetical protein